MQRVRASDVFVPNGYPQHNYVSREAGQEESLRRMFQSPGQVVSLAGPSKCGKTVLVERVVLPANLIKVNGSEIRHPIDFADAILTAAKQPATSSRKTSTQSTKGINVGVSPSVPEIIKTQVSISASSIAGRESTETFGRGGLRQVIELLRNTSKVVFVDDFHYIPKDIQDDVARQIKAAAQENVKFCIATATHRSEVLSLANSELQGRLAPIVIDYWNIGPLSTIALNGFGALHVIIDDKFLRKIAEESLGSPQIMQSLCLELCHSLNIDEGFDETKLFMASDVLQTARSSAFQKVAEKAQYQALVENMVRGTASRGTQRKLYKYKSGSHHGDVYYVVCSALVSAPPRLDFHIDDIMERCKNVCGVDCPKRSSVVDTVRRISEIAESFDRRRKIIEFDSRTSRMHIVDPYLLFYMRWVDRDRIIFGRALNR